jgi:aldehyde dehydrogenase (NAD+)
MNKTELANLLSDHRTFFATNRTKDLSFRREQLKQLRQMIVKNEAALFEALKQDLGKPAFEAYGGETGFVIREIDAALKNLDRWSRPRRVRTPLVHFPGRSFIYQEPYGVALIIGPWNFPIQLILTPLVGAMAAGNCALLKPSITALRTSHLLTQLIKDHFDPAYISVVEGGAETTQLLLAERFAYLFFTGGPATGRIVMAAAARHLTPITLELGGKNPCIVDEDVDLDITARRIVWGKFFNCGQSCVAPDYLLVHRNSKKPLLERIVAAIREFYGSDPSQSPDYGRIIDDGHFDRIMRLLGSGTVVIGGTVDRSTRYIAPTVLDHIATSDPIMQEEVFGPLLPVLTYDDIGQAIAMVNALPKPLALYLFSRNRELHKRILRETSSGGGCINDVVIQQSSDTLPFGGVGESGIGACHGKMSFDAFSHQRSIIRRGFLFDMMLRYPPYKDHLKWIRKIW